MFKALSANYFSNSIKNRIVLSILAQIISQILGAIFAVIILKIMTNNLGVKGYGIYATAFAFVTTFSLLTDLGLNAITGREIAKYPKSANEIISHNMGLRLFLCVIMLPFIFGLSYIFYPNAQHVLRLSIAILALYLI